MGEAILTAGNTRKYDIPLAHLDYGYVKSCSNVKELEKILKILRSGDEGCYPELELLTETRITELAPESRILRKEKPASRLSDLDSVSKSSIQEDIESWNLQMRGKEEELLTSGSGVVEGDHDLPPIRSGVIGASTSKKTEETKKSNKRVMPRDYREWDKVDVDKELEKVEAEDEEKKKEREKGGGMNANGLPDVDVNISSKGLTGEEKLMKANREKDKGNEAFRSGDYEESVLYYSRSLSLLPTTASYNNRALAYLKMSDWDRSLADLQRVLKDEPDNIKGLLRRGTAHKGAKDFQRAEQDFKRVLDLEPTNKRAKDLLTEIEEDLKKVDKAKTEKKTKGRRMVIEEVEGSESEGETQPVNGHGPEGENTLKTEVQELKTETKEVKTETNVKEGMKNGKDIWTEEDGISKDVEIKDESVKSDTVDKEASSKSDTSDHTYSKQEPCESPTEAPAEDETEESESSIHTRPVFHKQPLPADIAALREKGNNLFRTGQYAEALEKYEEAINLLDSQSEGHEVSLSLLYSNQAACKLKTGDCSSAIADCTMALDLLPHSIKPLLRRASAFEMKEKYKKAYTDYKHILSMDSSVDQAHQGATRCQRHLKEVHGSKWREALPPLVPVFPWEIPVIVDPSAPQLSTPPAHPAPQVTPKAPTPSTSQGSSTVKTSPVKEVSHSAKTSIEPAEQTKKSPEKVETPQEKFDRCKGKGNDHVRKSEFRQAVDCYTECVETLPDIAAAYTNRALCYIKLNQAAEALRDCDKALTLEPENTKALYRRAQAKKMLEQYKDSLADLLQLLRLEPNNKAAKGEVEVVKKYYKAMEEGEETPGRMSSDDNKRPCPVQDESTEERIKMANNEPEERTEGTTAAPSLNVTGVTGGAVGTSNVAGVVHGGMGNVSNTFNNTLNVTIPDHLHELLERTKEETECMTSGMVRVSAVKEVFNKLKDQRWVTITGNAGDGKTVLGYLVLKEFLQEDIGVFTVDKPEEYDQIAKMKDDKVIMFDDRFGAFLADRQLIKNWFDVIEKILKVIEGQNPKIKVIFISRKNVVNESKVYLGRLTDSIFDTECVIDLSKRKVLVERLKILEYHLGHENVTVDQETKTRVCNMEVAHGFPYCSKMFSKFKSKGKDVPIEEFFESPLKFLDMTTKVLFNDNCGDLFKLMIKNDGKFNVEMVEDEDKRLALLKVEKEQEGSYITVWRNGICRFAHPSVYESVLNVINDIDPLYCVKYATLSVIRQKMIISTSDEEDSNRAPCYIIVKPIPHVLKALAERFTKELLKGDYSVFEHRLCHSREFCEALVSACVNTKEQKQFINQPGKNKQTMLWTALKSGNMVAVQSLVRKAGADVEIRDERGRTPLQYLCQLKNSPAASAYDLLHRHHMETIQVIITEGRGDVNIRDQYGQTPLQYICQLKTNTDDQHSVHMETIQVIITEGRGDVNIRDQYGQTPLHYICQLKTNTDDQHSVLMETVRVIIKEGRGDVNDPDQFGQTPLLCLFKCQTLTCEEIKWIITDAKGDLNKCEHKTTPLHYLCAFSGFQLDTVDLVINEGKGDFNNGDEHGTTPFHYLCENTRVDFNVKLRITNPGKGDINKQDDNGITPLHVLCKGSLQVKIVLTLIKEGDKADMYGNTPLHFLCRRRGISDEEIQQLKQLPESNMKKQNNLGNTPLDYLNDQDGSLPWTDGMIARTAADLVLCKVKHGDASAIVLARPMILNSQKVYRLLQVEDFGRELNNMAGSGERNTPGQFKRFQGTCSSPLPLPPSPSPLTFPSYWETLSTLRWREGVMIMLEMGVKEGESNMDEGWWVSALRGGVGVSVWGMCHHHPDLLCIHVERRGQEEEEEGGHQVGECVSLPLPTSGEEATFTFGLVLDVGRGRVAFLDVGRGKLLCKLNLKFTQRVFPMFHVNPYNVYCATRMRLVSGREISVTDQKIQLIQQALSD